jgi:hypothetical protein
MILRREFIAGLGSAAALCSELVHSGYSYKAPGIGYARSAGRSV